jgi:hypothetical protein
MKFDEAGHGIEIGIAAFPDINKILFVAGFDFESVHCDKHRNLYLLYERWIYKEKHPSRLYP